MMKFGLTNDKSLEHFWSFVYFHGMLNDQMDAVQEPWEVPGDLVNSDTELDSVPAGIHPVIVDGKPCTLYLGTYEAEGYKGGVTGLHTFRTGYIVLNEDKPERHAEGKARMSRGY